MNDLLTAMKARLDSELASITPAVVVVKGPLQPHQWPAFDRYLIELIPGRMERDTPADSLHYRIYYPVTIRAITRRWDEEKSAYGTEPDECGSIHLCQLIDDALNKTQLGDLGPVRPGDRAGGDAQENEGLLDGDAAAREFGKQGHLLAGHYRVGLVNYGGWSRPQFLRR